MDRFTGSPVPYEKTRLTEGFWQDIHKLFRDVTVNAVYSRFKETGRIDSLKQQWKEGDPFKPHIFWDSDAAKWIEGAACFLQYYPDPELEAAVDAVIEDMVAAQGADGYLNTYFTVVEPEARFTRRTDHELYCAGHLIEGAIAYAKATGKTALLDVAQKYVDLIDKVFRVERSASFDTPGHQEIELALMRLYSFTGVEKYKTLAQYFLEERGNSPRDKSYYEGDLPYMQSHLPVCEQVTAEGHCVRALYMYCGMADIALQNRDRSMFQVCRALFDNITQRKMYITGGVGSTYLGESFTFDYDLPEYTAYSETCASIALAMFCKRLWLIDPDGVYADIAELAYYNTILAGVSLSGDSFFYENPLAANPARNNFNDVQAVPRRERLPILERVKVFECSCCPPNLLRFVGSISDYAYSTAGDTVFVHCYMGSDAQFYMGNVDVILRQRTNYPYDGKISIVTETAGDYTIAVRIPGWSKDYRLSINNNRMDISPERGYAYLKRNWTAGDEVCLELEMEPRIVEANPLVTELCGKVAIMRGPLVYCAEGHDNPYLLRDIAVAANADFKVETGTVNERSMPLISMNASCRVPSNSLYRDAGSSRNDFRLKLLPYFAWANRGVSEMTVWLLG